MWWPREQLVFRLQERTGRLVDASSSRSLQVDCAGQLPLRWRISNIPETGRGEGRGREEGGEKEELNELDLATASIMG